MAHILYKSFAYFVESKRETGGNMITSSLDTRTEIIDELLNGVCRKLQITPTMHKDAEDKYNAIGSWLAKEDSNLAPFEPVIYPQGSVRLGTTVKPIGQDEFDVDCICQLNRMRCDLYPPQKVYDLVEKRLKENEIYAARIERFKRCLRINYAGNFHLDITPSCPDSSRSDESIFVTDRKMCEWKASNPKGYARWFEDRSYIFIRKMIEAHAEPLPPQEDSDQKTPLKRAVQLFKRHRDIIFYNQETLPRSIVLTTLAGELYQGETSTIEALISLVNKIAELTHQRRMLIVPNPVNRDEIFSESWQKNPTEYKDFCNFIDEFSESLNELAETQGIHNIQKILERLFGEKVTREVIKEYSENISSARESGLLGVTGPFSILTLNENDLQVPKNTFYGN